jgi:hypothetical protein
MNFNYNGATEAQKILLGGTGRRADQEGLSQETCVAVSCILGISKADAARIIRQAALADSDWTQLSDVNVDKAAWATYRQALRDITDQPGFPDDIIWPAKPEETQA